MAAGWLLESVARSKGYVAHSKGGVARLLGRVEEPLDAAHVHEGVVEGEEVVAPRVVHELHLVQQQPAVLEARLQVVVEHLERELLLGRRVRRQVDLGARAAPELRADVQLLQPEPGHLALQQRALRDPVLRDREVLLREGAGVRHVERALPLEGHRQRPEPRLLQRHGDAWGPA
eukprot:scaffold60586_cov61-Phaeocystis_antarctica.AAC.4